MSNPQTSGIEILIWDLDGTLYQSIPELSGKISQAFLKILLEHKNISSEEAIKLLQETKKIYKSSTKSLKVLGCGTTLEIIKQIEVIVKKAQYLKKDPNIQHVFRELSLFRHILVSDTSHQTIIAELEAIGLSHTIFELIVGIDDTGTSKPDLSFFKKVIDYTDLPPKNHLMIGDRVEVDLLPAKQLGMKTCLVWHPEIQNNEIDFLLPTVYDIVSLFSDPTS